LGLPEDLVLTAHEDVPKLLKDEAALPVNADPLRADLTRVDERARLARLLAAGLDQPAGFVLPLKAGGSESDGTGRVVWESSPWPIKRERLYALPGACPLGLRLPLTSLPEVLPKDVETDFPVDPFAPRNALARRSSLKAARGRARGTKPREVVKTALTVQVRK